MRTQGLWVPGDTGEQLYLDSSSRKGNLNMMFCLGKCVSKDFLIKIENM